MPSANPVLVEVARFPRIESRHRGAAAVVDAGGNLVAAWGDVDRPIYPRSAVKPLQALALIETGAADAFSVDETELALACASHGGTREATDRVAAWLARIGLTPAALECGAHPPTDEAAAEKLIRAGQTPNPLHNNCSGKHAGMLTTALKIGAPARGYIHPAHPVQERIRAILSEMADFDAFAAATGTDGCGVPTVALPLGALARSMARMTRPDNLAFERGNAVPRILKAMTAFPHLVAPAGRLDAEVMAAAGGAIILKRGAEGVQTAMLPHEGLGLALKIDDGAPRAAETAMAALLVRFAHPDAATRPALAQFLGQPVNTCAGAPAGVIRPARRWLKA